MKLGRKPRRIDKRTFKIERYMPVLPPIPTAIDWTGNVPDWGELGNDTVGDCTCAAAGHLEMLWTSQASTEYIPSTADVLAAYSAITGYNPADPSTDQGANMLDVLNFWRNAGIAGHKIKAYAAVNPANVPQIKSSVALFGGLYAGVNLPQSAIDATMAGQPWTNVNDNNIAGGHAIPIVSYNLTSLTCITGGQKQIMTWAWLAKYMDEGYCVLSQDWFKPGGLTPSGFNMQTLNNDLQPL